MKTIFINDTSTDNHFGCELVVKNINYLCETSGIKIIRSVSKAEIVNDVDLLGMVNNLDFEIFLINGEGSFHHDSIYCKRILPLFKIIKELGKEIYLINASWSSNSPDNSRSLLWAKECIFRESLSAAEAAIYFKGARVLPDITLYGGPEAAVSWRNPKQKCMRSEKRFLYTDSVNIDFSIELDKMFRGRKNFELLTIRYSQPGFYETLCFLRSFFSKKSFLNMKGLWSNILYAIKYYKKVPKNITDFINKIDAADLVITARFHVMTCCILRGIPFMAVLPYKNSKYTDFNKIRGLISDLNLDLCRLVTLEELRDFDDVDSYDWSDDEIKALGEASKNLQKDWENVFKDIIGAKNV